MKSFLALALFLTALTLPLHADTQTWKNAALMDAHCSAKMADNPDAHPRSCALQCAAGGYGLVVDGKFLRFDDAGNEKALAALKKSEKKDHLRATVTGTLKGDVITVSSIAID